MIDSRKKVGRPFNPLKKEPFSIRLHPLVKSAVQKIPGYNSLIQKLLCEHFKIDLDE